MIRKTCLVLLSCCVVATSGLAAGFAEEFTIVEINNRCSVKASRALTYSKAVEGRAYPFGTRVKTGRSSSAIVRFSEGNECRIAAHTTMEVDEEARDRASKILRINRGEIEVQLEEGFERHNRLRVETPTAVCGAIGCLFTVKVGTIADLFATVLTVVEGLCNMTHERFTIDRIGPGTSLSIGTTPDGSLSRLKIITGKVTATLTNEKGEKETFTLPEDAEIKIMTERVPERKVLRILIVISVPGEPDRVIKIEISDLRIPDFISTTTTTTIPRVTPTGKQ